METESNKIVEVGKRYLLTTESGRYGGSKVNEFKVIEFSPSGNWVKLMNINGLKFWKKSADVSFIEELQKIERCPKNEEK